MAKIAMLGSGFIAGFYTQALQAYRNRDEVIVVYGRDEKNLQRFSTQYQVPNFSTDMAETINAYDVDLVVVGLPNHLHLEAIRLCAEAGKGVLCTKPLGRNAGEAKEILGIEEKAGIFHGYLEDLAYTPKTLKALESVQNGAIGKVTWARSRETHPGPHSDWFWNIELAGGGAIVDLACHCIEIGRNYIGKDIRPVEVMCWADTLVKPIAAEDNAIGLVKYATGAIAQFEVSWSFRGGLDLRDEVAGTDGTLWINNFLRTGFDMFSAPGRGGYVSEKAETESGWIFPVGDENIELGYLHMFRDMINCFETGQAPMETFYDGYVVNAIMDACYASVKSKQWEPVELSVWRGKEKVEPIMELKDYNDQYYLVKEEKLPDGSIKTILKDKVTGEFKQEHMLS